MNEDITNRDDGINSVCCFDGRQSPTNHDLSDLCDTVDDVTTDSISNGKLKGDLRILRTQLISKSLLLESDHLLFKSKDYEYQEQVQTLSRRLALASRRCEAAMQVATQVNAIQSELHKAVINQKCLQAEKEALANEVAAIRQLMSTLVTDHLIYTNKSEVDLFEIDVGAYSQLRGSDLYQLSSLNSAELSVKQYVQLQIHRLVILFAEELLRLRRQLNESAKFTFLENPGSTPTRQSCEAKANCNSMVPPIQSKRRQHSLPPLLDGLTPNEYKHVHFPVEMQHEQVDSSVSAFRLEPSSSDVDAEQNKTPTTCSDHELILLRQQVKLLQSDKEYLLNEVASLSARLTSTGRELTCERARTETYSKEINELHETVKVEQRQKDEEFARRLAQQAEEFIGLARMEFIKMRSLAQETHNAELTIMRQQRNHSILEADQLRARLDQAQQEIESQKHHLQSLLKGQSRSKGSFGAHESLDDVGYSAQERLVRAMVEAENAQAARADALLKVEKLTSQLDASKKSYYEAGSIHHTCSCYFLHKARILERCCKWSCPVCLLRLEFKSRQERVDLECKLQQCTAKLEVYEKLERQLDEALEDAAYFKPNSEMTDDKEADLFEHIKQFGFPTDAVTSGVTLKAGCVTLPSLSARRLEHAMKLAKQVAVLKRESQKLLEQLDEKNKEIELAHQNAEKLSTIVSLSGQPVDTLACRLAEREAQLKAIRERLSVTEKRLGEQTAERECLLTERNSLASDLNRLLNRRQTLTKLRNQLATVLEHSTNQPNTSFGSSRLCSCPCVCKHSCQSTTGCVRKRIISCRRQLSRTESPPNFRHRLSPAPYDTDRS
ncbi:hypothetical protein P879_00427 [Paragonimus westermani]|uniref:Progesterone-induced-blocking factor 1 n=1 Tax=Paragonimus westermani TaxID=34504 RepID=A0A8T0DZS6_9TREM|nr:hypothetical protein P879_00427 [Paragonimus westermani]